MKTSCEIIKDLLPLYHDNVCSEESRALVEEHIGECSSCAKLLSDISDELEYPINAIDEAKPIKAIQRIWKKDKRKAFIKGTSIAVLICAVLAITFILLTQWYILPIKTDALEISDVSMLSNGGVVFNLGRKDNRQMRVMHYTYTDTNDTVYITPKRTVISIEDFTYSSRLRDMWLEHYLRDGTTTAYIGTPDDRVLLWQEGMELPPANEEFEKMSRDMFHNLFITNQSDVPIFSINIHAEDGSTGVTAGHFSPIEKWHMHEFHMDEGAASYFIVQVGSKAGDMDYTIAQEGFTKDFSYKDGEQIHLYIRDGDDGTVFITDSES